MVVEPVSGDPTLQGLLERMSRRGGVVFASGLWGSSAPMVVALAAAAARRTFLYVTAHLEEADHALDDLDAQSYGKAKLGAVHRTPRQARQRIREGALRAIQKMKDDPGSFRYPDIRPPFVGVTRLRADGDAPPREWRAEHPDSFIALMNTPGPFSSDQV